MNDFTHVTTIRVRYSETDQMKIVYNANYLAWFEIARTELCRKWGRPYTEWEAQGLMLPVVEAYCRYKSPARYDDDDRALGAHNGAQMPQRKIRIPREARSEAADFSPRAGRSTAAPTRPASSIKRSIRSIFG